MKALIYFFSRLFSARQSKISEKIIFTNLKITLLANAGGAFGDGVLHWSISSSQNIDELMAVIKKHFVVFSQWGVITPAIIEEYELNSLENESNEV
jgi:hypothetical protein